LRHHALNLVNAARREHGLSPLQLGSSLNQASQKHADDMLRRRYYAHTSPEGNDVQDRYTNAGGSRWRLVEENIARCAGCQPPVSEKSVDRLQQGWMNSPHHRENILRQGLDRFGYGIVDDGEHGLYAVQTFAGPGTPRGVQPDETAAVLGPEQVLFRMVQIVNAAREKKQLPPLKRSDALSEVARSLMPPPGSEQITLQEGGRDLFEKLPPDRRQVWSSIGVIVGACGGCGTESTLADLRYFREQWLEGPRYEDHLFDPSATDLGFALQVNGKGRKVALAVVGAAR
ncbi:MAG: CAP domain-containing protein, partial [Xanthobacteraceae bacterium]